MNDDKFYLLVISLHRGDEQEWLYEISEEEYNLLAPYQASLSNGNTVADINIQKLLGEIEDRADTSLEMKKIDYEHLLEHSDSIIERVSC